MKMCRKGLHPMEGPEADLCFYPSTGGHACRPCKQTYRIANKQRRNELEWQRKQDQRRLTDAQYRVLHPVGRNRWTAPTTTSQPPKN